MKRFTFYTFFLILFFTATLSRAVDLHELKSRTLKVTVVYTNTIFLNKITHFKCARKFNTRINSNNVKIRKAFSGFEYTKDVVCTNAYYKENIERSTVLRRNRKAILSRKIFTHLLLVFYLPLPFFAKTLVHRETTGYLRLFTIAPFQVSVLALNSILRN
jgi:hypothetical protein